jgi:hypothetical protein
MTPDFQSLFPHRDGRVHRCEQYLVEHSGVAGNHAVKDIFASALHTQRHTVESGGDRQE